jgi:hypothetical protein
VVVLAVLVDPGVVVDTGHAPASAHNKDQSHTAKLKV